MQIVNHLRVKIEIGRQDVAAQRERQPHVVAIVVVRHIVPPVHQRWSRKFRVLQAVARKVDLAVAAIDFQHRRREKDQVVAYLPNQRCVFHRQPVHELHQHLGAPRFGRMHRAGGVVHRLAFRDEPFRLLAGGSSRIGETARDLFVMLEIGDVLLARHRHQDHLAALFAFSDGEDLHARRCRFEGAHVSVDVFGVGQMVLRAGDVA